MAGDLRRGRWPRGGRSRAPTPPTVRGFAEVPEATLVAASLPRTPRPLPASRRANGRCHPTLVARGLKPLPAARVAILPGGVLTGDSGGVVCADGRLVLESLWDEDHFHRSFEPPAPLPPPGRIRGRHASLISLWSQANFHHWLFEALPRLAVLEASGVAYDGLIVPAELASYQRDTLALAGVDPCRLVPYSGHHLAPDELVWVAPMSPFEQPTPDEIAWLRRLGRVATPTPDQRLYLSRRGARRVVNERAVTRELARRGFRSVDPGGLSMVEQIALFASASALVGPHGAAFSGGIFSSRLTAVEFFQDHHVNISTTAALVAAGHDHWHIICRRVPSLRRRRNQDLHVPLHALRSTLDAAGLG